MLPDPKEYGEMVAKATPPGRHLHRFAAAFLTGGGICALGQLLQNVYLAAGWQREASATLTSVSLIAFSALLTGLGLYDRVARLAGAGTLVPITGFANAVASAAMEFRTEGLVPGVGARMFSVAGPVIVYGLAASAVYGLVYWLMG